jgi:SAM-dependent methyltransferase
MDDIDGTLELVRLRLRIASIFITSGYGLEIAPWENPLHIPGCNIRYIEIDPGHITQEGQVLDNGEVLSTAEDESLDFIIACHVLEHFRNPIKAIETHLRKLRPKGYLYYILPDKDLGTCDVHREVTAFAHLVDDYRRNEPPDRGDPGHLHVWNASAARCFFDACNTLLGNPYHIVHFSVNPPNKEDIVMLQKKAALMEQS